MANIIRRDSEVQIIMKPNQLNQEDIERIIEMAWEDDVPFDAIESQYGLKEQDVIELMRTHLKRSSFQHWRKRVTGRQTKHRKKRDRDLLKPSQAEISFDFT